ncbi:TIGR03118 family protein [Myxococcus xanthus]|uniref:TIGR03118 family protein n=2 Tax=Myxococcus xanthus TaxID=34 RepID=A0AAE6KS97_MYXXA|nr:TIGR03118 family protein [Myxococcus xanthus]QDE75222.1 TIGR03118 family protein [Myxococcus xanthus]QDE82524.1 TIGR03118 family protein [Myxococcus xanthus]QDE96796.1 TIGR03118 family protein [Myxococcus xanthus]
MFIRRRPPNLLLNEHTAVRRLRGGIMMNTRRSTLVQGVLSAAVAVLAVPVARAAMPPAPPADCSVAGGYTQRNLVANSPALGAEHVDPHLVNAWGLAFNPMGVSWVANEGTGTSTLYDGNGVQQPLIVGIPAPPGVTESGEPTGVVFNGSEAFVVTGTGVSGPARFIFATEEGVLAAWAPAVDEASAKIVADNSAMGSVYKGLAMAGTGADAMLYAADFRNNRIDVFNSSFTPMPMPGAFADPSLPAGYAPFNIQDIGGTLYVSYAQQDEERSDDVPGVGAGYINAFDMNGQLLRRFASQGALNAPWGMALAPAGFGQFSNHLLVGNFGDGAINAYDPASGAWAGALTRPDGQPLKVDGLWSLHFGTGVQGLPAEALFFTAGPADEEQGLYGRLDMAPTCRQGLPPWKAPRGPEAQ